MFFCYMGLHYQLKKLHSHQFLKFIKPPYKKLFPQSISILKLNEYGGKCIDLTTYSPSDILKVEDATRCQSKSIRWLRSITVVYHFPTWLYIAKDHSQLTKLNH